VGSAVAKAFCTGCGGPLAPGARFCAGCGQPTA
jgi:predicted amidophosphoribosyltransferase